METARMISSPVLRFPGGAASTSGGARSLKLPFRQVSIFRATMKARMLSCEFSDSGHLQYYQSPLRGDGRKLKEKTKEMKKEENKKIKLIKRLSKDLDFFSRTAYSEEFGSRLMGQVKGKMISEASEILLAELEHFKSAQKELKRKRKEEKSKLRKSKAMLNSESSSSSSSESSDSDCEGIVDMRRFTHEAHGTEQVIFAETSSQTQDKQKEVASSSSSFSLEDPGEDCCGRTSAGNGDEISGMKIAVCMGGKCKKLGAAALLQEFEEKIESKGTVVSCKCMGKCKSAPNVKVSSEDILENSVQPPINPLYIGVKLEDVGAIVANLLIKERNDDCLVAAS